MQALLQKHIEACNTELALERARVEHVAELNSRALFLGALGTVPPNLREEVRQVLAEGKK